MDELSCLVDGCVNPQKATGLCGLHYARKRKHGTTDDRPKSYVRQPREKQCVDCGDEYQTTGHNSKRCKDCLPAYQNAQNKKYRDKNRDRLNAFYRAQRAADPEKYRARAKEKRLADPERQAEYQKRYQEKHRVKIALKRRCYVFGITMDELLSHFESQGGCCAICVKPLDLEGRFDVDHCHNTGRVRGILCLHCNRGIGMLRDDPTICEMAATYLRTA